MSVDLYLHIGTEKTGTTSIQRFLKANRELLGRNGILYPAAPGEQNHLGLTVAALEDKKTGPLRKIFEVRTREELRKFREALTRDLAEELKVRPYTKAVMSGEHCSSRLVSDSEVERLKGMLSPLFDRIFIVIYIRRQDDYLLSTYSTTIKSGRTRPLVVPTGKRVQTRYDHWQLISRWARAFGKESILCRKYEKPSLKGGDVILDFLDATHIDQNLPFERPESLNESLDANTLEFLRLFNKHVPRFVANELNKARDNVVPLLGEISKGPLATLSEEDLKRFMSQFLDSNRQVAIEYFGGEASGSDDPLFAPRADERERTREPALTVELAVEISAWLWQQKQAQIERMGERMKKQNARLAKARQRRQPASSKED
jgi:hypothetical protein